MIGDQGIEGRDQKQYKGAYSAGTQGRDKVGDACRKQTHLKKGIKGYGSHHVSGAGVADLVEEPEEHRMHPGVVVGVGDDSQHLFKLVDAVRSHDARVLIQIVGQPAKQAEQKGAEHCVIFIEAEDPCKTGREPGMIRVYIAGGRIVIEKQCAQIGLVTGVGEQKQKQMIKQKNKAGEHDAKDRGTVEPACEKLYVMWIVHQHIQKGEKDCGTGYDCPVGALHELPSAVYVPVKEKNKQEKYKCQDIARFHAGSLHQRPGAEKTLKHMP